MHEDGLFLREEGGSCLCQKTPFKQLTEYQGENVMILSPGFQNDIGFRSELAKSIRGTPIILMIWGGGC